jgi:hypothetical protein
VVTAQARIRVYGDHDTLAPILIPELDEVRRFAAELHARGIPWTGDAFGGPAEYCPQRPEPPLDSKLPFAPADFCIGKNGVWFFSLQWEHGKDAPPVEFLDASRAFWQKPCPNDVRGTKERVRERRRGSLTFVTRRR